MNFDLVILGSGAALPTSQRKPTSHYVCCNDRYILIDCGEGTQMQIRKYGLKLQRISIILISHLHGDHFFGLVGLISTMHLLGRDKGLKIFGPKGLKEIVMIQLEATGNRLDFDIQFVETNPLLSEMIFEDTLIEIYSLPLKHRVPTTGFLIREKEKERILDAEKARSHGVPIACYHLLKKGQNPVDENGKTWMSDLFTYPARSPRSYAYCSDTAFDPSLVKLLKGVDVLYHEATFLTNEKDRAKKTYHSTASQAAEIAKLAGVKKLLIGHLSARYTSSDQHKEEATIIFPNTEVVGDGEHYLIS